MRPSFSIITNDQVKSSLLSSHNAIYNLVKKVYVQHDNDHTINPPSYFLRFPDKPLSRIIALPAAIMDNPRVSGIKWIASNPENLGQGLQRASAVIILNDYETGYPFACLEGSLISAIRTSYSAVAAVEAINSGKHLEKLGVVGSGRISYNILKCLHLEGWKVDSLSVYDTKKERVDSFLGLLEKDGISCFQEVRSASKQEALGESDVVVFCTTSKEPHVENVGDLKKGATLLNISLRDISPDIIFQANNIVDDVAHVLQANTSPHLAQEKYKTIDFINGTIGEFFKGEVKLDPAKITIFSPMGLGVLDIALANFIYDSVKREGELLKVKSFFG